ncbi:transcriptional-regulating factor 1-like [Mobula hypostoma]|uniref:transcriptional-regulating factor 1-like n=1 Tax=Mobula hypostoma TaxID=723540 RepID=UPI002FC2D0BD
MSEQMGASMPGDCGPLLFYERHCPPPLPPGLDGVGLGGPAHHGFTPDCLDGMRPHAGSPKMAAVTGDNGWPPSGLSGPSGAKPEGAAEGRSPAVTYVESLAQGRLDSFDEAFPHHRSIGQGPGVAACATTPTLRQMLAGVAPSPRYLQARLPQGPHCRPQEAPSLHCAIAQARGLPGFPQRLAQPQGEADGRGAHYRLPHVHQAHRYLQGAGPQPGRGQEGRREDLALGAGQAQSYVCGPRLQYCMTETPRESVGTPVYQHNSHGSPVTVPTTSPHYLSPCQRPESENACVQLLDTSTNKFLTSQLCPTDLYWEQVHQAPLSCDRVSGQRRGPEEKEEASYPFNRGSCKDQFRNVASFQGHAAPGGGLGTSHIMTQNDIEKIPRDTGHFSPHLPTSALAPKAPEGDNCGRDSLLAETSGDFLSGQELTLLDNMVDYATPESAEDLDAKYPPVTLYRSLLRLASCSTGDFPGQTPEHLHYTPRPMLDPTRRGTGLYSSLSPSTPAIPPFPCSELNGFHCMSQDNTTQGDSQTPCINVGPRFQALVPERWETSPERSGEHRAELVWKPWKGLVESREVQGQVENLLNLACSSALPGGGLNREFALHCLSEVNGDVLVALEKLLLENGARPTSHQLADYHYSGTSNWTPSEKRLFNKAFAVHKKDFRAIQKVVRTKVFAECVEYYYSFKKSLKFNKKLRSRPSDTDEDWNNAIRQDTDYELSFASPQSVQPAQRAERESPCPTVIGNFPCKQCGKMFYKIKSRNAHMKIHRQQDDWHQGSQEAIGPPTPYSGPTLGKPAPTPPLYPSWDGRELPGQVEVMSEAVASGGLTQFYHPESKFGLNRSKCPNFFL